MQTCLIQQKTSVYPSCVQPMLLVLPLLLELFSVHFQCPCLQTCHANSWGYPRQVQFQNCHPLLDVCADCAQLFLHHLYCMGRLLDLNNSQGFAWSMSASAWQ